MYNYVSDDSHCWCQWKGCQAEKKIIDINLEQFEINTNNGVLDTQTPVPSVILNMCVCVCVCVWAGSADRNIQERADEVALWTYVE